MKAQTYFRLCLFVPLLVPLPFYLAGAGGGLSTLLIGSLVFGMPPYVLFILLPMLYLFDRLSERQIVVGIIFFPIVFPLLFGLFWLVARYFIETVTISFSDPSEWVFIAVVIPAFYSMIFLSGNVLRKILQGEMGILEQRVAAILCAELPHHGDQTNDLQKEVEELINLHRGERTNVSEDRLLVEFASVINAVKCGLDLHQTLQTKTETGMGLSVTHHNIGIDLGEVVNKGNHIYGEGVTVAASLQERDGAGDLYISGRVFDRVKKKLIFNYDYLGEFTFQNVSTPVRVYRLLTASTQPDQSKETVQKLELPDKPSIAVLPFDNMSSDPEQEYFSDGLTEDIITDLSKLSGLMVISRHSTFIYKGKSISAKQVSEDLGVRYVLEGSVRKAGKQIRINAQLIDATIDDHVWAAKYDHDLHDIFAVQDEVMKKIVEALQLNLTADEKTNLHLGTTNAEAHDCYLRALEQFYTYTPESAVRARAWTANAIELDPTFAKAFALKARIYVYEYLVGLADYDQTMVHALPLAERAVELAPALPQAHVILSWVHNWMNNTEEAVKIGEHALSLDENDADACYFLSMIFSNQKVRRADEALQFLERLKRLNPHYDKNVMILTAIGITLANLERYEESLEVLNKAYAINPNFIPRHLFYFGVNLFLEREGEARTAVQEILRINPSYTVEKAKIFFSGGRTLHGEQFIWQKLKEFGVPE